MKYSPKPKQSNILWKRGKLSTVLLVFQATFVVLFALFVEYDEDADANPDRKRKSTDDSTETNSLTIFYPMFQDSHVMIFLGFGFIFAFLKRYGYSSVGFNFLIGAFVIQWSTLMRGFLHLKDGHFTVSVNEMVFADFACATIMFSFGVVIGRASALQLIIMSFIELIVFHVTEYIGISHLKVTDVGGSMFVHAFGAYFGLAVSRVLYRPYYKKEETENKASTVYHSDLFSILGTLIFWIFWPSFNAAASPSVNSHHRAIINTYYSLCGSALVTFAITCALDEDDKFNMAYIQNSTIAGGVAVGTLADLMIGPWAAMLCGSLGGAMCTLGIRFIKPVLNRYKIHDTCGVHYLHGLPGIMAAIGGVIAAYVADEELYGKNLYVIFPGRAPSNATEIELDPERYGDIVPGDDYTAGYQAAMQGAALVLSIATAIVGGLITGLILKNPIWNNLAEDELFEDKPSWHLPNEGYPHLFVGGKPVEERDINVIELKKDANDNHPEEMKDDNKEERF